MVDKTGKLCIIPALMRAIWILTGTVCGAIVIFGIYSGCTMDLGGMNGLGVFMMAVLLGLVLVLWLAIVTFYDAHIYVPRTLNSESMYNFQRDLFLSPQESDEILKNFRKWVVHINQRHILPVLVVLATLFITTSVLFLEEIEIQEFLIGLGFGALAIILYVLLSVLVVFVPAWVIWRAIISSGLAAAFLPKNIATGTHLLLFSIPVLILAIFIIIAVSVLVVMPIASLKIGDGFLWIIPILIVGVIELMNRINGRMLSRFFTNRRTGVWQ